MSTDGLTTRVRGNLSLGDYVKVGLAALLGGGGVGGMIVGGSIYFSSGKNNENIPSTDTTFRACLFNESGATLCHQRGQLINSGSYVQKTEFGPELGTGAIFKEAVIRCRVKPNATTGSLVIQKNSDAGLSAAQSVIRHHIKLGTGTTTRINTGLYLIPYDGYFVFQTASGTNLRNGDCNVDIFYQELYDGTF